MIWEILIILLLAMLIVVVFLGTLAFITYLAGKEIKTIVNLFQKGKKLEFTTKPGYISLSTILLVFAFCFIYVTFEKVVQIYTRVFELRAPDVTQTFAVGLAAIITAIILNFIFLGMMERDKSK